MALAAMLAAGGVVAADLPARTHSGQGVTVTVTPLAIASGEKVWSFKVVLDTHSQALSDDMTETVVLLDGRGGQSRPLSWKGAPPGGHHREGILSFPAFTPLPGEVELRMQRPAETAVRSFRWSLN